MMRALWEDAGSIMAPPKEQPALPRRAHDRNLTLYGADAVVCICEGLKREIVGRGHRRARYGGPECCGSRPIPLAPGRDAEIVAKLGSAPSR